MYYVNNNYFIMLSSLGAIQVTTIQVYNPVLEGHTLVISKHGS